MNLKIGDYVFTNGIMLAPMAGVTDSVFRKLCKSFGAEYTVSEMVCAKALCYEQTAKKKGTHHSATAVLARVTLEEMPMAIQIFGSEPSFMAQAAQMLAEGSYIGCTSECKPTAIDINMGCPVRKITSNGEGSALMRNVRLAHDIVSAVTAAVNIPVTVKIRSGWDAASINAPEFAKALEDAGAAAVCVHARTREQLYSPGIELSVIEKTKKAVNIPVIGNGDIYSAKDAVDMMNKTGCDGVMIGRGAQGNPWIFSELSAMLGGREYIPPTLEERIAVAERQLDGMIADKGERTGLAEAKKHMAWYIGGVRTAAEARKKIMLASSAEEIKNVFGELIRKNTQEII